MNISKFFHTFPLPAILLDNDFSIVTMNDLVGQLLGFHPELSETKSIFFLFPDINLDTLQSNFKVVTDYCTPQGKKIPFCIQMQLLDEDNLYSILYISKAIEHKAKSNFSLRKEVLLKQKLNIFELFLNHINEGVLVFNDQGRLLYLNGDAAKRFGVEGNRIRNFAAWQLFEFFGSQEEWEDQKKMIASKTNLKTIYYLNDSISNTMNTLSLAFHYQKINKDNFYVITYVDITESRRDKLLISEQNNQINIFHKNIPAALFQFVVEENKENYFSYVSDSFYNMFGFSITIEDKNWSTYISDYAFNMPLFLEMMKDSINEGIEFKHIGRFRSVSGEIIWVEINAVPAQKGNLLVYNGLVLNITERKEFELENIRKRAFNDSILFSIPADIAVFDSHHNYMFINPNGIANDELREWMIGKNDFDYCEMKGIDTALATLRHSYFLKALETKNSVDWVDEIMKEGKKTFVLRRFSPFFVNDELAYMIGYGIDITELKRTQSILSETQRQNELILKSALDAIVIIDKDWKIIFWNPQAEEIFDWSANEVIGNYLFKTIFPQNDEEHQEEKLKAITSLDSNQILELSASRKDGKEFPIELIIVPIDDVDNSFHYCAFIRDISNRKEKENEIERQNRVLKSQNIELEQFTYIASHDLQEPLLSLISFSQLLVEEYNDKLDEEGQLFVRFINQSAKRMRSLISGLMEYARINKKEQFVKSDLNFIIQEVLDDLKNTITKNNALVEYNTLPMLYCHSTHIRLLFQNLISNAIKFTAKGVQPIIKISCVERESDWLFSIQDNGIGIDPRNVDYIFLIFKRLHNYTDFEGHGIGLAHCKKIVDIHNGEIWVESELGKGSTFYFTLSKNI